ncbi:hypothetical protein DIS24_g9754 [Lasiodiplodia hormozganensis]|uniref:Uncharacterized protein n=1 Tax=Lasiodiplodia hormozganensis TaxID=869390 RepID=A0AA39XTN9_9PEZI|nr:hypothetical protein DIS24_g9754 [Lasiodiplodia hormozganensis]
MYLDEATAISHLRGGHELIRLRGGADTLERLVRRVISWCEYHSCAAHQLRPMLAPIPPPAPWGSSRSSPPSSPSSSSSTPTTTTTSSRLSPFPTAFVSLVSAAHARTAAHLPPPPPPPPPPAPAPAGPTGNHLLSRIFAALTLVGTAISAAWQPAFQAYSPAKEAAAAVLDDALYAVLVEVARLHDDGRIHDDDDDDDDDDDGDDGVVDGTAAAAAAAAQQWAHAVLLHAAHAYLWAALSDLPASPHMHDAFLSRLRGALEAGAAREAHPGGGGLSAGWMWRPSWVGGSGNNSKAIVAAGPMDAETLMWVLAVGWFLADKRRAMYGGGEEMVGWFGDRVEELLGVVGVCERESAVGMVRDFPGTDGFRVKWRALLRGERFCWLS